MALTDTAILVIDNDKPLFDAIWFIVEQGMNQGLHDVDMADQITNTLDGWYEQVEEKLSRNNPQENLILSIAVSGLAEVDTKAILNHYRNKILEQRRIEQSWK